jgi:hypothetical protein
MLNRPVEDDSVCVFMLDQITTSFQSLSAEYKNGSFSPVPFIHSVLGRPRELTIDSCIMPDDFAAARLYALARNVRSSEMSVSMLIAVAI